MSFKVAIKDYQIIKKASLEFIPGLNVITGPSNNGKSSIFKAIKANMYTVPGTNSIRAGQSNYAVGITYNGHTVILQKGLKESIYLVDGEKYTKFGVNTPEIVSNSLNIKELVLNGNKEQLNFWDQMNYPFLLDKTPVELFRFIIDSGDSDKISQVLKDMVSDRQSISKEIDQIQGSINLLDSDIEEYINKLSSAETVISACNSIIALQEKISRLNTLNTIKLSLDNINQQKSNVETNYNVAKDKMSKWTDFNQSIKLMSQRLDILKDLFIRLHVIIGDLSDIEQQINKVETVKNLGVIDTSKLIELKSIKQTLDDIINTKNSIVIKPVIECGYSKDDLEKLTLLKSIKQTLDNINHTSVEYSTSMIAFKNSQDYYSSLKALFKICPVCGSKL